MPGHLLGVLESPVILQVNCDPRCPPGVTFDRGEKTREANFADRFGVSRSTLYRNAAGPESPKMLMMYTQSESASSMPIHQKRVARLCEKISQMTRRQIAGKRPKNLSEAQRGVEGVGQLFPAWFGQVRPIDAWTARTKLGCDTGPPGRSP
jgi:hypothetical protein